MNNPQRRHPPQRTDPGESGRCSAPTGVAGHRMAIPPALIGLGQLQLLAPRLRPPPQRRLRITRHRIHLSPRENGAILRQHRKLNRRILTFTQRPTQRSPYPMRPPPRAFNNLQRPDTKPLPRPVRLRHTPSSHTQRQPRLRPRRIPRHHTLSLGDRRRVCSAHQPPHRGALPPGLHTTRDLRQPERHRAISNELTQRPHHPLRRPLRPCLTRHTPSMRNHPDNPTPQTPDSRQTAGTFVPPDQPTFTGPQGPEPPAAGALPRTPAPLRRAGEDHQAGCLLTARTSPARRRATPRKGHTTLALRTHRPTAPQGRRKETTSHHGLG